jgi:hypothetical protein
MACLLVDGMFATLVLQLPSTFTGGEFVVTHGGVSRTFDLALDGDAALCPQYVCHYADCEHELKPVTSGHRLALVYSLCWADSSSECTSPTAPAAAWLHCMPFSLSPTANRHPLSTVRRPPPPTANRPLLDVGQ